MSINCGKKIKEIRISKGLTQLQLAEKADIGLNTLCRYERDERRPKLEVLEKIADALEVNLTDLFFNENSKEFSITHFTPQGESYLLRNDTMQKYDLLNFAAQQKVNDYISDLLQIEKYKNNN